ncbi:MAG TPA: hypothetical protein VEA16_10555 [Vicinamibacterales bacterium]|nr:hypothetical protein [Vicinamibacterales bacterium]
MDLIDRYIAAVRRHLPQDKQDDIALELRDSLRSEAEERERSAGRALTEDDLAELVKKHGHPWLLASRYLPQQYLIGPALYPYYRQAMVMVVLWVVVPLTVIGGALALINSDHPAMWLSRMIAAAWNGAIYAVGIVTIVFAILEHEHVRITALDSWNPARLPSPGTGRAIPRSESLTGLVLMLIMLVWWTELVRVPVIGDTLNGVPVRFEAAPIWAEIYWPVVIALAGGIAILLIDVVRPLRTLAVSLADIAINLYSLWVVATVLRSEQYIRLAADPVYADTVLQANHWVNVAIYWSFIVVGIIVVWEIVQEAWHLAQTASNKRAVKFV